MFATARHAWALTLAAALVVAGAEPVFASERTAGKTSEADVTVAASTALAPALTSALTPSVLADAVQRPPVPLAMPRSGDDGMGSSALRRSLYVSFGALNVLDAISTRQALDAGAREANPAMASVARNSTALFAVKAGSAVATTFFAEKLAKKHPRRAAVMMAVLNGAYAAIAVHNLRVARAQR